MEFLILFLGQVAILLLMLAGMFFGECVNTYLFGEIKGFFRKSFYLLLFVSFLALGGYLPEFSGLVFASLVDTALFFSIWGFVSVFSSRSILFFFEAAYDFIKRLLPKKKKKPRVDICGLLAYLQKKGLEASDVALILEAALGSRKKADMVQRRVCSGRLKGRIPMNPCRLSAAIHHRGLRPADTTAVLVRFFRFSPEKAASIWKRSI